MHSRSISSAVSLKHRLVTDTDRWPQGHVQYSRQHSVARAKTAYPPISVTSRASRTRSSVKRRKYCQLSSISTDDGRRFISVSAHFCRIKLTTRCDDRRSVDKFLRPEFLANFQKKHLYFDDATYFVINTQRTIGRRERLCQLPDRSFQLFSAGL